ncbi:MAG: YdiU family protein [Proteobacteria bacterium]|nr:YdiU family protein [Pseudomonadota bacterium]
MPLGPAYRPDPRFQALGAEFSDPVEPADFPKAIIRLRNDRIAARVGLETLSDAEWVEAFARFEPLPDNQPDRLAMRYHGHQFRTYNPDLGDGRGFLFAQLREKGTDRLLDLGTKGSGRTPWSRDGDGRLTLKGAVREALATEMLEALGVPTSKTLSLIETGEQLARHDEPSPTRSAVIVRLSHSHIRFGTFQRLAYFDRADLIAQLIEHVVEAYYPELAGLDTPAKAAALLAEVAKRAARLAGRWTAAGFVHGVLNTDNLNITGESFDYGPYRFAPRYDPDFTAAYFDHSGLYRFGRQAEAVFWNLNQLAGCLTLVGETDPLVEALNSFGEAWMSELRGAILNRLGVKPLDPEADAALATAALKLLGEAEGLRWEPLFFDWFCGVASEARAMGGVRREVYAGETFEAFRRLLAEHEPDRPERLKAGYFAKPEPQELLYDEIEAIWERIAEADDWSGFEAKIAAIGVAREGYGIAVP